MHRASKRGMECARGFSLIELLIGMTIMAVALLSIAAMFSTGYNDVGYGGKATVAAAAARQVIEDMQNLPFANLALLNNYNTTGALPGANPEREVARKFRDVLAGPGAGFNGQIAVGSPSATLRQVTVTVNIPGRTPGVVVPVQLVTLITRL
jgi:prepilin-type N-terminal cleavage/methylation domain-containing protein